MTSRQLALVIWLGVAVALGPFNRGIRDSTIGLIKTALQPKLLIPAVVSLCWNAGVLWWLYYVGFWTLALWWDTAVFILVGTTSLVWRAARSKDFSRHFYARIVLQSLGISLLVGTIASTYTFSLPVELLLVPWLVLLGGMQAVASSSGESVPVGKLIQFFIVVTGLAMLARAVGGATADYTTFLRVQTVQSLLLLFVLTAAYLPYLFLMRVWASYDTAFILLRLGQDKPISVRLYARLRILARHRFSLSRLERFRTGPGNDLRWATSRAAVDEVFAASKSDG